MPPAAPPTVAESQLPLREGSSGWPTFALQGALGAARLIVVRDGFFGPDTTAAVCEFQARKGLAVDGRVGPATQAALVARICKLLDRQIGALPDGLSRGMALGEGGNNMWAVNWSVAGGVDCGLWQWRVLGPPFSRTGLELAFSPHLAGKKAMHRFLEQRDSYYGKRWVGRDHERAARCAVMAHNWPVGALDIANTGRCTNPDGRCTWVPRDDQGQSLVRFLDGTRVETRWQWCQFYAMGGEHGEASITRFVTSWT